ncbi:MAG: DMT family transporter [Thaumarchaeota archaeon]|nr:DMT family transporter [Nitrososphaerota archaeon]
MHDTRRGFVYALGSAISAGAISALSKALLAGMKPLVISGLVFLLAGLVLLPYRPRQIPGKRSAAWMLATGFLGAALAPSLYLIGLDQTSAVNASLLNNTEVFFTALIAFAIFKETLKRNQFLEGILVVAGVVVVATNLDLSAIQQGAGLAGNLLVIGASFVWAIDNNLSRITSQKFGPLFVSKFRNLVGGGLVMAYLVVIAQPIVVPIGSLPLLVALTAVIVSATVLFMAALVRIGAVRSLLVFSSASIFGSLFAVALLGEAITPVQLAGGALILSGVYLIQRSEGTPEILNS